MYFQFTEKKLDIHKKCDVLPKYPYVLDACIDSQISFSFAEVKINMT